MSLCHTYALFVFKIIHQVTIEARGAGAEWLFNQGSALQQLWGRARRMPGCTLHPCFLTVKREQSMGFLCKTHAGLDGEFQLPWTAAAVSIKIRYFPDSSKSCFVTCSGRRNDINCVTCCLPQQIKPTDQINVHIIQCSNSPTTPDEEVN